MNGLSIGSRKKAKSIWEQLKMNTQPPNTYGTQQQQSREGSFRALQVYIKKIEKSQINNLTLHLKELGKQQQIKPRVEGRK